MWWEGFGGIPMRFWGPQGGFGVLKGLDGHQGGFGNPKNPAKSPENPWDPRDVVGRVWGDPNEILGVPRGWMDPKEVLGTPKIR